MQGDEPVVVQLSDRHVQPPGVADPHDGFDTNPMNSPRRRPVRASTSTHTRVNRSGLGPGRPEQLGRGRVVEEPGQRLVLDGDVPGEDRTRTGASGWSHSMSRSKKFRRTMRPSRTLLPVQRPAPGRGTLPQVELEGFDVGPGD